MLSCIVLQLFRLQSSQYLWELPRQKVMAALRRKYQKSTV